MSESAFVKALANLSPEKRAVLAEMLRAAPEPIAIIGMACRFPGAANDPEQFWKLLAQGRDAVTEVPADRWPVDANDGANGPANGSATSRHGAFIDQIDQFDAAFFGIAPREAARMDPQQRVLMEVAWEALESAGQTMRGLAGSSTGVFVGIYQGDYSALQLADASSIDAHVASGMSHAIAANRLSHFFDLHGPSLALDTACSSSLVALHLAVQSLRQKETDMAIVGGVNLMISPLTVLAVARWGAMAADGRIKAFDAAADGFVRGEGCGVIILKRLSDAQRDGDRVLAICRGTAVNQDGRTNVLTAPNGLAQKRALEGALQDAGLRPEHISYIEAHGTGTPLGDPIEMEALQAVYRPAHDQRFAGAPLWVGSVKTNIGHLEAAAGMAGLIKTVLALRHALIPPHLHFRDLNPHISVSGSGIAIPTQPVPWSTSGDEPRRAGVSSFGFGGTNAHVILEEVPASIRQPAASVAPVVKAATSSHEAPAVLTLSAPQPAALPALARAYRAAIDTWQANGTPVPDICHSAALRRTHFNHRLAVAGRSHADIAAGLDAFLAGQPDPAVSSGRRSAGHAPGLVFVFSGQGDHWPGMATELYRSFPAFRAAMDECDAAFQPYLGRSIIAAVEDRPQADTGSGTVAAGLEDTALAQPAVFALQVSLAALWQSWGLEPAAVVGHSLGEVAAAYLAGGLTLADAVRVVAARSRLMQTITGQGRMAVVGAAPDALLPRLARYAQLAIAAVNSPASTVVAGDAVELADFLAEIESTGAQIRYLSVNYAFHSPQVRSLALPLERQLEAIRPQKARLPMVSTVTGEVVRGETLDAAYWAQNMAEPVLFARAIETLAEMGLAHYVEISPHPVLGHHIKRVLHKAERQAAIAFSLRRGQSGQMTIMANLAHLFAQGVDPAWQNVFAEPGHDVALPAYPWQRQRYWFQAEAFAMGPTTKADPALHPLLQRPLRSPLVKAVVYETIFTPQSPPFQGDHRIHDVLIVPATAYLEMVTAASQMLFGPGPHAIRDVLIRDALVVPSRGHVSVQLAVSQSKPGALAEFEIYAARDDAPDDWQLMVRGKLETQAAAPASAEPFDAAAAQARCGDPMDGEAYYQLGEAYGGALGPRFRCIRRLWRRPGEVVGQLEMSAPFAAELPDYTGHPAYVDAAFHIAYAAQTGDSARLGILMPVSFDEVCYYRPAGPQGWCHFTQRPGEDRNLVVGDARLYDLDGRLVAAANGIRYLRATGQDALLRRSRGASRDLVCQVAWLPQAQGYGAGAEVPAGTGWLILAGEGGYGRALAQALRKRGHSVAMAFRGASFRATDSATFYLNSALPEHYRQLFDSEWVRGLPAGWHVVDLWMIDGTPPERNGHLDDAADEQLGPQMTEHLLPLVQAAAAQAGSSRPGLWLVTRNAQPAAQGPLDLGSALAWGFGRTVALEHPGLIAGMIDVGQHPPEDTATILASELIRRDGEDQIAWRGDQRFAARLVPLRETAGVTSPAPEGAFQGRTGIRADATYLVTGATGGIGRHLARWLAEQGARHLLLLSRTADAPGWDSFVASLRDLGAEVRFASADVADFNALSAALFEALPSMPPLRGVFHAAGVVADAAILQFSSDCFSAVMPAKIGGAWNLHRLTDGMPLDCFVLFSSAAAVLGSPGQSNYAAANAGLDALAHYRHGQGLPALSVNWGPWDVGMAEAVGDKGRQRWQAWGMEPMPPKRALQHLARLLSTDQSQVVVLPMAWPPGTDLAIAHADRQPLFREMMRDQSPKPAQVSEAAVPKLRPALLGRPPRQQKQAIIEFLGEQVAAILGWQPGYDIDPQQGLFDIGLDSLSAVELKERVDAALELPQPLPATIAFDYPTLDALAAFVLGQLPADSAGIPAPGGPADGLESLSEDELAAMLADELRAIDEEK
jgi:myxalamid-type polyketide synthase MxaD